MLEVGINLVLEFLAVDRASSSASAGRIASLYHEVGDNAVEDDIVVVASLRKRREVLTRLIGTKDVSKLHNNKDGMSLESWY